MMHCQSGDKGSIPAEMYMSYWWYWELHPANLTGGNFQSLKQDAAQH